MSRIVDVPAQFDDRGFEQFVQHLGEWPPAERLFLDARGVQWATPYAMVGLLTAGQAIAEQQGERPLLAVPQSDEVRSYWSRMQFFHHAADLFEYHGRVPKQRLARSSDTLLEITPVRASEDVHALVGTIQEGAQRVLTGELGLEAKATMGFAMALSETCQNIVEHSGTGGWVAVQAYNYRRRLGRRVAVIAVSDAGIGFRRSLEGTQAKRFGDRWRDGTALEAALIQNVSRFRDPGRGQGFAGIRRYLQRWHGKISARSGTARLALVPPWDDDVPLVENLPFFPGAQIQVTIPAQDASAE
jgi:anti-sigma regulatory factor (Ser/Thr protein kinase)